MRILHLIGGVGESNGGPGRACLRMAEATAALGHDVMVLTTNQDGTESLDVPLGRPAAAGQARIVYCPIQRPRFFGTSIPLARAAHQLVAEADVVHLHSMYLFHDAVGGFECARAKTPYLLRPHGTLDPYLAHRHRFRKAAVSAAFMSRVVRHAAAIHFTSQEEMVLAQPMVLGRPGVVVPLGVDLAEVRGPAVAGTLRDRFPSVRSDKVVLFLGRVNFIKGLDLLMPAMRRVFDLRDDTCLVVAGPADAGFETKVRRWASDAGVLHKVHFTGMVTGDDKRALLADSDVFVLPSYSENFGLAVVEAMAAGLPVVVSNRVNIWRDVVGAGAGLVVECDVAQLADALTRLLADVELAGGMGAAGWELAENHFSWAETARGMIKAYARAVEGSY